MNKHGQALVEFIIILPILLLLLLGMVDFGRIILSKIHLENVMNEVMELEEDKIENFLKEDKEYNITYQIEYNQYKKIILKTKLELMTPGLKNILHNPYEVIVERSVLDE